MSGGQRKNAWTTKDWRPEERRGEEKMGGRERERGGGRMVVESGKRESEGEARGSEDRRWWKREETIGV